TGTPQQRKPPALDSRCSETTGQAETPTISGNKSTMASFHPKILWPHGIWHEIVLAAEGCLTHDPTVGWETSPVAGTDRPSSRYLAGMTTLRRAIRLRVAGSLTTALLAGCGRDDDSGASDEPSASPPSASPSTGQPSEPSESPTPEALAVDFGK